MIALLKEWAIEVGSNVVVDASGMGQMLGTGPEVPLAAKYDPHPITDRFRLLTAYAMARSVSSISAGANNRFAQNLIETSPRSWAETDIKQLMTSGRVEREEAKGDKPGPVSLGAAVSAAAEKPPTPPSDKPDAPQAAGDADRGDRRLGFRLERMARDPGQSRSVHEFGELARAAGEHDFDPAARSGRPPHHRHRRAGAEHLLADRVHHSRADPAGRHPDLVGEAIDARRHVLWRCSFSFWFRSRTSRRRNIAIRRRRLTTKKLEKVFSVESDKIEEVTIKSESGERTTLRKAGADWQVVAPADGAPAAADASEVSGITSNLSTLEQQRVIDENAQDLKEFGLAEPRIEVTFKAGGEPQTLQIGAKTPTGSDVYAKIAGKPKVFLIPSYLESTFNRKTFDLRDKSALKIDAQKVDSLEIVSAGQTDQVRQGERHVAARRTGRAAN